MPHLQREPAVRVAMAYVSPDGILYPCLNWRDPIGDLREKSFKALWKDSPAAHRQREITRASYGMIVAVVVSEVNVTIALVFRMQRPATGSSKWICMRADTSNNDGL